MVLDAVGIVEQLGQDDDAVQRCSDFMADGGQELIFCLKRLLQLGLNGFELRNVESVGEEIGRVVWVTEGEFVPSNQELLWLVVHRESALDVGDMSAFVSRPV